MAEQLTASIQLNESYISTRLDEAGRTLLSLPSADVRNHGVMQTALESYGWEGGPAKAPSAEKIARMDEALGWIALIPLDRYVLRRVVGARALVSPVTGRHLFPWRRLGKTLGADHKAIQRWHAQGLALILGALRG